MLSLKGRCPRAEVYVYTIPDAIRTEPEILLAHKDTIDITTHMRIGEPAGAFSLRLVPEHRDTKGSRPWDKIVGAGDYVEIYLTDGTRPEKPTIRGFVDNSRKAKGIGPNGDLIHYAHINGRNFGGFVQDAQVYYRIPDGSQVPTLFVPELATPLSRQHNVALKTYTPDALFQLVIDQIVNEEHLKLIQKKRAEIPLLNTVINVPDNVELWSLAMQYYMGSAWNFMQQYQNAPWYEMFVREGITAPEFVFRPTPWRDLYGNAIPGQGETDEVEITEADVIDDQTGTSRNELRNFFFTVPARFLLQKIPFDAMAYIDQIQGTFTGNPWADTDSIYRHGFRPMRIETEWAPVKEGEKEANIDPSTEEVKQFCGRLNTRMVQAFKDNHLFRLGTIEIGGNPNIEIGRYLRNTDTNDVYYIEGVDHKYVQYKSYTTTVTVTRGVNML